MKHTTTFITQDQFAKSLIQHLSADTVSLTDATERLRFARQRALAAQKIPQTQTAWGWTPKAGGSVMLGGGSQHDLFNKLGAFIPLVALVVGLLTISQFQNESRAKEVADIDSELLTDDLSPTAYADQGFGQFLKLQTVEN